MRSKSASDPELHRDGETTASGERVEVVVTVETKNDYEYLLFEDLKPAGLEAVEIRSGEPLYAHELKSGAVTRKFVDAKRPAIEKPSVIQRNTNADTTGRTEWLYQELRDRKVAIFASRPPPRSLGNPLHPPRRSPRLLPRPPAHGAGDVRAGDPSQQRQGAHQCEVILTHSSTGSGLVTPSGWSSSQSLRTRVEWRRG